MQLPVTLLYDYQSVGEVVEYINGVLMEGAAVSVAAGAAELPGGAGAESDSDVEEFTGSAQRQPRSGAGAAAAAAADSKPSQLLKTLRLAPPERPLFLAAPGVANAQSAYFSFSQFLQVS